MKKQNRKAIARQRRRDRKRRKRKSPDAGNAYTVQRHGWMADRIDGFLARFPEEHARKAARIEVEGLVYQSPFGTRTRVLPAKP